MERTEGQTAAKNTGKRRLLQQLFTDMLEENLKEEKAADLLLTNIAENSVNWQALEAEG